MKKDIVFSYTFLIWRGNFVGVCYTFLIWKGNFVGVWKLEISKFSQL